jgi:ADP-ribose pyrophosphatase
MPVSPSDCRTPSERPDDTPPTGVEAPRVLVHEGPVFKVETVEYQDAVGRSVRKDVVRHPGAVTVVPVDVDGAVLMVRVGRLAVGRFLLEFCAGKLEAGEDPLHAAGRELEEEVGRRASVIEPIGSYLTSPGFCDERMHAYLATGLTRVPQRLEAGEEIEIVPMRPREIDAAIADGRIEDGKSIVAWHLLRARLGDRLVDLPGKEPAP